MCSVSRAISAASLSPRPDRQTTIDFVRLASLRPAPCALATACELSSAGRMPSVRASAWNAARASSSRQTGVRHAAGVFPIAVLGADAGIVEPGRDRMHVARLAVFVLHHVAEAAVQHAGLAVRQRRGVIARLVRAAAGFDADQLDARCARRTDRTCRPRCCRRRRRPRPRPAAGRVAGCDCSIVSRPMTD